MDSAQLFTTSYKSTTAQLSLHATKRPFLNHILLYQSLEFNPASEIKQERRLKVLKEPLLKAVCVILVTKPPIIISRTLKKNDNAFKRLNCAANYTLGCILTGRLGNCEHSLEPGSFLPTPVCRCRVLAPRESCRSASSCCHCWVSSVPLRRLLAPRISKPRSRSAWLTPRYRSKAVWEKKTKSKNC